MEEANRLLVEEAKKWVGVRGISHNHGPDIERFQKAVDGKAQGEPWCAGFVWFCIKEVEKKTNKKSWLFQSESVVQIWRKSPFTCRLREPSPGCLMLWVSQTNPNSGHMGFVIAEPSGGLVDTIEGNTSSSFNVDRSGNGVYQKKRHLIAPASGRSAGKTSLSVLGYLCVFEPASPHKDFV